MSNKARPCPQCGSRDNLKLCSDGSWHCFTPDCGYHEHADGGTYVPSEAPQKRVEMSGFSSAITDRRISELTCRKFGVTVETGNDGKIAKHHYPYFNADGDMVAAKTRIVASKDFYASGTMGSASLFGQNVCKGKGKFITITEGEADALAVSEMFDRKWDVVSLRNGASSAASDVKGSLEFLESYDKVVLCFDNDGAGQKATQAVRDLFSPEKLLICKLPLKDAGDMLKENKVQEFVKAWWDAKPYRPDGIVSGQDLWDEIVKSQSEPSIPYPWQGLNTLTKGFRLSELVTITSGSGMGKSQMVRELEYYLLNATTDNVGVIALEETTARTALGIMSVAADCPLHLEENLDHETIRPFFDATMGTGRYFLYDHFGSTGLDNLMSRIRFMVKSLDCRYIILDHLSIVVSSQENGDERKAIDEVMTKLRTLVQELGIGMFLISHLRRAGGTAHEDGGRISLSELRGSQSIAQLSDIVIGLERDQQHPDPIVRNTSTVRVLKNRYTGQTGPATWLQYDVQTGRMNETSCPQEDANDSEF